MRNETEAILENEIYTENSGSGRTKEETSHNVSDELLGLLVHSDKVDSEHGDANSYTPRSDLGSTLLEATITQGLVGKRSDSRIINGSQSKILTPLAKQVTELEGELFAENLGIESLLYLQDDDLNIVIPNQLNKLESEVVAVEEKLPRLEFNQKKDPHRDPTQFQNEKIHLKSRINKLLKRIAEVKHHMSVILEDRQNVHHGSFLSMFISSWNVGNASPKPEEMGKWIPEGGNDIDLIVIGLQECEYHIKSDEMKAAVHEGRLAKKRTKMQMEKAGAVAHAYQTKGIYSENHTTNRLGAALQEGRLKLENGVKKTYRSRVGLHFLSLVLFHLGPEYSLVKESELAQMRLFVIIKKRHLHAIRDLQYASTTTGVGNIAPNKGGVIVSLRLYGLRFAWISCHLTAHRKSKNVKSRNECLANIFQQMDKKVGTNGYLLTSQFDHVFLLGDLNYRVNLALLDSEEIDRMNSESNQLCAHSTIHDFSTLAQNVSQQIMEEEVFGVNDEDDDEASDVEDDPASWQVSTTIHGASVLGVPEKRYQEEHGADASMAEWNLVSQLIFDEKWSTLMKGDQLINEMSNRRVLTNFEEGCYDFAPTFKVTRNPNCSYVAKRCPSYCDRILWHSVPGRRSRLKQVDLRACPLVSSSDHKPVASTFVIDVSNQNMPSQIKFHHNEKEEDESSGKAFLKVEEGGVYIVISELRATDLMSSDYDGQSDPYVVFCSPNLFEREHAGYNPRHGAAKTRVLKHRLDAAWPGSYVIKCPPTFATGASIRHCHLVFALWDKDHVTRDDMLGQAILGLGPVGNALEEVGNCGGTEPKEFTLPVLIHGSQHGVVRGKIQVCDPFYLRHSNFRNKFQSINLFKDALKEKSCCCIT